MRICHENNQIRHNTDFSVDKGKSDENTHSEPAEASLDDFVNAAHAALNYISEFLSGDSGEGSTGDTVEASSDAAAGDASSDAAAGDASSDAEAGDASSDAEAGERASDAAAVEGASDTAAAGETSNAATVQASSDATVVNEPIVVKAGETFDGGNKTYTAGSALGDGSQDEGQDPIFKLEEGATLKNVVIGENGADGVHVYGDVNVDNVHWTNVGEDALTVKKSGDDGIADVQVTNSSARNAEDKVFQLNDVANLTLDNFAAEDFGKLVRTNGGLTSGDFEINLNDITATNGKQLVRSEVEGIALNASNITAQNIDENYVLPDSATINLI